MNLKRKTPWSRSPYSAEAGVAMVEFALVLPLLLLLLLGMVDFGRAFNYWIDETHLANEGARWAVVDTNPGPGLTLQESIRARANTGQLSDGLKVCVTFPDGTSNVGDPVKVELEYDYDWLPFLTSETDLTAVKLTGSAVMRLEAEPTEFEAGCFPEA